MTTDVTSDIILTEEDGAGLFSPKEIKIMISENLNPKKALGYDRITARILQELLQKELVMLNKRVLTIISYEAYWNFSCDPLSVCTRGKYGLVL